MSRQISRTSSASYTRTPSPAKVKRILLCLAGVAEYRNLCIELTLGHVGTQRTDGQAMILESITQEIRKEIAKLNQVLRFARRRKDVGQGTAEDVSSGKKNNCRNRKVRPRMRPTPTFWSTAPTAFP